MSQWTAEQEGAILARGASVVVSAAAGSGKTSVLVERLIRLLEDRAFPAEKMVVVTFTNDAAGEVRARLNRALSQKILADPDNTWLRQQQKTKKAPGPPNRGSRRKVYSAISDRPLSANGRNDSGRDPQS